MTAPNPVDPVECLNSRTAGGPITCGEPASAHCSSCLACGTPCACPPLPAVGTQVLPREALHTPDGYPVPWLPHTVVATWDHRRTGAPDDHVIVLQLTADVAYAVSMDQPIDTQQGATAGLDDITVLDLPHITFTAEVTS